MIKINMSKKEIALSALTTIICHILLLGLMVLMIVINTEGGTVEFFRAQIDNVVTVAVASSVLTMVVYFFFFIENKAVLCKYSKILEIYLLLGVALVLNDVPHAVFPADCLYGSAAQGGDFSQQRLYAYLVRVQQVSQQHRYSGRGDRDD